MRDIEKIMAQPEMEYRPRTYWGWLENITPEETRWQVDRMAEAGLGGYVMHARGGLTMPYAGKQWMDSVRAMVEQGRKYGMVTIVDDEHGWPSGFVAGKVNGKGEKYQLKYLKTELVPADAPKKKHTLGIWARENGMERRVYVEIDPYYVDNMDPDVVDAFLEASYEDYNKEAGSEFGNGGVYGVFSDEPQTARYETPWSDILPELFEKEYSYALLPELYKVFENVPGCEKLRCDLYGLMGKCFAKNYAGRIGRWCEAHGLAFLGHTCIEEEFVGQLRCALATMPFYEYMTVPGIDWLTRSRLNNMVILQVTSAAAQLGKKRVLSEMFGCAGWSVTPEEMKWIAQWQHMLGINDQLQHLGLYSLRGSRKREYPASIFYQQPWFQKMKPYNDHFARISKLIAESTQITDLLVLHPMHSAWAKYDGTLHALDDMQKDFWKLLDDLLGMGLSPHLGDEVLMKRHGRVTGKQLEIGSCRYSTVLIPPMVTMDSNTCRLLREFALAGGMVYVLGELPGMLDGEKAEVDIPCTVISNLEELLQTHTSQVRLRGGNGFTYITRWNWRGQEFYYAVNNDLHNAVDFSLDCAEEISLYEYEPMENKLSQTPYDIEKIHLEGAQALLLFAGEKAEVITQKENKYIDNAVCLDGKWKISRVTDNAMTLDFCRLSLDGIHYGEEEYILDIQRRLLTDSKNRNVWLKFTFRSEFDTDLNLLVENPEKCRITVNGSAAGEASGWCIDKCLEMIPISVQKGENEIIIERLFENDERVYFVKNNEIHEAEANRVTVNTELESVYLWGQFGVKGTVLCKEAPRRTVAAKRGSFVIYPLPEHADISCLEQEGFPFFAGEITLSKTFACEKDGSALIKFARPDTGITEICVNGEKKAFFWAPYEMPVQLQKGNNEIKVTLTNSCRNMFGPHYSKECDPYGVGPHSYGLETQEMYFVRFGVEGGIRIYEEK